MVIDAMEVGQDLEKVSKYVSLALGSGVLVDLGVGETLGESRVCRIICRNFLSDHGRG